MEYMKNPQLDGNEFFLNVNKVGFLLLHGFTATTTEVRLLAGKLHKDGYTISAPLLPGHGTTPVDMNRCKWQDWYGAVESHYLELKQKVDTVFVGGESMGALLGLLLASRQPGIRGLLCYSPALIVKNVWLSHFLKYFIQVMPKGGKEDSLPWKGYIVNPIHAAAQLHKLQLQTRKVLPTITVPTAIFASRIDTSIEPLGAEIVYEKIGSKDKEIHWFNESSHCMILDKQLDDIYAVTHKYILKVLKK
ncbi:MAG: alpha/beta fold hydrolase [Anaerolineaceae bacterium]|nr:alpha/beta fold hydrolase [Anaerolineaceae bacterium]